MHNAILDNLRTALNGCAELEKFLKEKIAEITTTGQAQLKTTEDIKLRTAELDAREAKVKNIEDVVSLSVKTENERAALSAERIKLDEEKNAFVAYLEIAKKEVIDEKQNIATQKGEVESTKKNLEAALAAVDEERKNLVASIIEKLRK